MKVALCLIFFAIPGWPEVVDSAANGFTVRSAIEIQAPPEQVYRRIVGNVGDWWSSEHTFSGDAHNLTIEEKPMGCFCEKLPKKGAVRHMELVNFAPGETLVFSGALGPLQAMAATGSMTISLAPVPAGTKLTVTYAVVGYMAKGFNILAAPVDAVLRDQFVRLKNYVERGDPNQK